MLREPRPFTNPAAPDTLLTQRFVLSREKFDLVPVKRGRYIILYLLIFAAWGVGTVSQFYYEATEVAIESPPAQIGEDARASKAQTRTEYHWKITPPVIVFEAAIAIVLLAFYTQFIGTLRLMGYPRILILGYCTVVFLPIPGILAVAYIDRQIAKAWNKAEKSFQEQHRET